jgi:hypothetical protein
MVKLRFLLSVFLIAHISTFAQEEGKTIEYDLGQVSQSKPVHRKYEIKEKIKSAVSLCECVKVKVIPGKDASLLEIEFNPAGYHGQILEEIKLLDETDSLITLRIKAYVKIQENKT